MTARITGKHHHAQLFLSFLWTNRHRIKRPMLSIVDEKEGNHTIARNCIPNVGKFQFPWTAVLLTEKRLPRKASLPQFSSLKGGARSPEMKRLMSQGKLLPIIRSQKLSYEHYEAGILRAMHLWQSHKPTKELVWFNKRADLASQLGLWRNL